MQPNLTSTLAHPQTDENSFRVLIAYQDESQHQRAEQILRSVWARAGAGERLRTSSWSLSRLQQPRVRNRAAREAARADMIVISSEENDAVAGQLENWVRVWLGKRRKRPGALVTLLQRQPGRDRDSRLAYYLENVARQGQLDFFGRVQPSAR